MKKSAIKHVMSGLLAAVLTVGQLGMGNTITAKADTAYELSVDKEDMTVTAGESVTFKATVSKDDEEISSLKDENIYIWWWADSWDDHADGNSDASFSNYDDNSGLSFSCDVEFPSEGTYYVCCQLQDSSYKDIKRIYTTVTVEAAEDDAEDADDEEDDVEKVEGDLDIDRVKNLSDDFKMGVDISSIFAELDSGVVFYDYDGNEIDNATDFCKFLKSQGITDVRFRVWNDPYDSDGNGYGGGNCDVAKAKRMADACRAAGLHMLVDFHCSDTWTDPSKYYTPKAWEDYSVEEKADALESFIKDSLDEIDSSHDVVTMVQVGNETTSGFVGETDKTDMCTLFKAGSKGVREYNEDVKVVIHVTNPEKSNMTSWAATLDSNEVDYDVLATSYYPYWHGTLDNLTSQLESVQEDYGKEVMVAETSYAYTLKDSDGEANTVRKGKNDTASTCTESFNVQGQATSIRNLINTVSNAGGIGVFYWEPAWITVGDITGLEDDALDEQVASNKEKWEKYGSGWASSYAGEYDAKDAGQYYGGTAVDNEAMFYPDGTPTAGWHVWNYVKTGATNTSGVVYETEEDEEDTTEDDTISYPNILDADIAGFEADDDNYTIAGEGIDTVSESTNTHSGSECMHWWNSSETDAVSGTVTVNEAIDLEAGDYVFMLYSQGYAGDTVTLKILDENDEVLFTGDAMTLTGWANWVKPSVSFTLEEAKSIKLMIYVDEQAGGWGTCDDMYLYNIPAESDDTDTPSSDDTDSDSSSDSSTDVDSSEEESQTVVDKVEEKVEEKIEEAQDKVAEATEQIETKTEESIEKTTAVVTKVVESLKATVTTVISKVQTTVKTVTSYFKKLFRR